MQNDKERALEHEFAARTNDLHRHAGERIDAIRAASQAICRHARAGACPCIGEGNYNVCEALTLFGISQTIAVRALDDAGLLKRPTPKVGVGRQPDDPGITIDEMNSTVLALNAGFVRAEDVGRAVASIGAAWATSGPRFEFASRRRPPWWRRAFDFLADALALTELTDKEPADALRMYRSLLSEKDAAVQPAGGVDMRGPLGTSAARHEAGAQDQESGLPAGREHGAARGPHVGDGENGGDRAGVRPAVVDHLPIPYWWAL